MNNRYEGLKIAMFGACGTGKTTLATALSQKLFLPAITDNARKIIASLGITDIRDVDGTTMTLLEHALLLLRIKDQLRCVNTGFISDRTALDQVMFWHTNCEVFYPGLTENFVGATVEYLKYNPYDLFVYVPVEFELETSDTLRYFDDHRHLEDKVALSLYLEEKQKCEISKHFITVHGSVEERVQTVLEYLEQNIL